MDVELPDGTKITGVPDDYTQEDVKALAQQHGLWKEKEERGSILHPLARGATLGFGERIAAGGAALIGKALPESMGGLPSGVTVPEAYRGIKEEITGARKEYEKRSPKVALAAELLGGVATGAMGAGRMLAGPAVSRGQQLKRLVGAGAVPGGIAGAGYTEEDDPAKMVKGAATGAVLGGALGAAIPAVGAAAVKTGRGIREMMPKMGGTTAVERGVSKELEKAGLKSEAEVQQALKELGPDATIADLSEGLKAKAEAAAQFPGAAREAANIYKERNKEAGRRVAGDVDKLFQGRIRLDQFTDDIVKRSEKEASPLYQMAKDAPIELTPDLAALMKTDSIKKAWKEAQSIASDMGVELPIMMKIKDGKLVEGAIPDMESWNLIKQGLDEVIDKSGTTAMGKVTARGRSTINVKNRLLGELDKQNPIYGEARKVYGGLAETKRAAEDGQKFWNLTDYQISRKLKDMSISEKEAFRLGALQKIYDEAKKTTAGGSAYMRLFGSADKRDKIKAVLQNKKAFSSLENALKREDVFNETFRAIGMNSATARRLLAAKEAGMDPSTAVAAMSGVKPFATHMLMKAKAAAGPTEKQREELAKLLMKPSPDIKRLYEKDPKIEAKVKQLTAAMAGGGGVVGGRMGAQ